MLPLLFYPCVSSPFASAYEYGTTALEDKFHYQWCQQSNPTFSRPFNIALVADPQIGWDLNEYNSEDLFRKASEHLKDLEPDFILVAGDLIQTPRNQSQFDTVKAILDLIDIPYHVTAGNHDVRNTPTLSLLNEFVQAWNLPHYWYSIPYYNTLFLMLDSNSLRARDNDDADEEVQQLAREQFDWLEQTINEAHQDDSIEHIIPIAHHPLATHRMNEGSASTNTPRRVREELANLYVSSNKISHVFAGHFHDAARITESTTNDGTSTIEYVTYPSTGVILGGSPREPSGFAILKVDGGDLKGEYYGYNEMPDKPVEAENPGFSNISVGEDGTAGEALLLIESQICITWTTESMAQTVLLEYSIDDGMNWSDIGMAPNHGVIPWQVLSTEADRLVVRISSMVDPDISASSDSPIRIAGAVTADEQELLKYFKLATAPPTDISSFADDGYLSESSGNVSFSLPEVTTQTPTADLLG